MQLCKPAAMFFVERRLSPGNPFKWDTLFLIVLLWSLTFNKTGAWRVLDAALGVSCIFSEHCTVWLWGKCAGTVTALAHVFLTGTIPAELRRKATAVTYLMYQRNCKNHLESILNHIRMSLISSCRFHANILFRQDLLVTQRSRFLKLPSHISLITALSL